MPDRKTWIYIASWVLAVGALVLYFALNPEQWSLLLQTPLLLLLALCLLVAVTWFIVFLQSYFSIRAIATPPPFFEYLAVFYAGLLVNYSPLRVGVVARAVYLARFHDIKLSVFSAISVFRLLLLLFAAGVVSILALYLLGTPLLGYASMLYSVYLGCAVLPLFIYASIKLNWWQHFPQRVGGWILRFGTSFAEVNRKDRLILFLCLLLILQFTLVAVRMKICFDYAGMELDYLTLMVLAPLGTILSVLAITPGGIGVREFVVASVSVVLGYSFEQGMQALIIDRISMISVALVLGSASVPVIARRVGGEAR